MSKSTSCSTCTAPKLLLMPRMERSGGTGGRSLMSADAGVLALGFEALAQVGGGDVAVGHHVLHVGLVDGDRRGEDGGHVLLGLRVRDRTSRLRGLALEQRDGGGRGGVGFLLDGLVDRHA